MRKRERQREAERRRERIPSRPCTVSTEPELGLKLTNLKSMTQTEIESQRLSRIPGAPLQGPGLTGSPIAQEIPQPQQVCGRPPPTFNSNTIFTRQVRYTVMSALAGFKMLI